MRNPKPNIKNAAGACNTNGISRNIFHSHISTKGEAGRKPSLFRVTLDYALSPLWLRLPRHKGRLVFHALGFVLGRTKFYSAIGASYIRFLKQKEAA